jgi:hypothetical protein
VATIIWKALKWKAPQYVLEWLIPYSSDRGLRSNDQCLLVCPRTKTSTGAKAFSVAAPKFWNSLPLVLRQTTSVSMLRSHFGCTVAQS